MSEVTHRGGIMKRPVVTICGSTRFRAEIVEAERDLTFAGVIVLGMGVFGHSGDTVTEAEKIELDMLHIDKIEMSDGIYVVNPSGYIGQSTAGEIAYARALGKEVDYLVPPPGEES